MLTQSRLKELLHYDPDTGVFTWLVDKVGHGKYGRLGARAGAASKSEYRIICIDFIRYREHHLAFLYMTGSVPAEVDHIDTNKKNNAFANLRSCTRSQNTANTPLRATNRSGIKGVCFDRNRGLWVASITVRGKQRNLGRFSKKEDAARAYSRAAKTAFGEFARIS